MNFYPVTYIRSVPYQGYFSKRMTDREKNEFFRDYILWQQDGLDIEKQHCLFINFGVSMKLDHPHIRRVIMIFIQKFRNILNVL